MKQRVKVLVFHTKMIILEAALCTNHKLHQSYMQICKRAQSGAFYRPDSQLVLLNKCTFSQTFIIL